MWAMSKVCQKWCTGLTCPRTGRELLQQQVDLAQDLPVAPGPGRVVAGVLGISSAGPVGVGQVEGMRVGDRHGDPELGQGLEGLVVEGGDRLALEWDRDRPAVQLECAAGGR